MIPDPFKHGVDIDPDKLKVERFLETQRVRSFDCGNQDLNDFLNTAEVEHYEKEGLGRTYLVFYGGDLVAYFTISSDGLRVEYLKKWKSFSRFGEMRLEAIPSIKIGRLAVTTAWQAKGVGRHLVKYIAGMALDQGTGIGARLLILQAEPDAVAFYLKCGFEMTAEVGRERGREKRTMFLDLHEIPE